MNTVRPLLTLILLTPVVSAQQDRDRSLPRPKEPIPYAYTCPSADKRSLFVMLPPVEIDLEKQEPAYRAQTDRLRKTYGRSGLYRPGETTPVWTYDGPYTFDAVVANDGRSLIVIHGQSWFTASFPMAARLPAAEEKTQLDSLAVSFYRDGTRLKSYTVRELVGDPALVKNSISHLQWRAGEGLVEDKGIFRLHTQDRQLCLFDIATGELIEKKTVDYARQKAMFGILFAVITVGVLIAIRWLVRGPRRGA